MDKKTEIEAAVFRRFLKHLDDNKQIQNIDLMITADFCRNCLSKWYKAEAEQLGEEIPLESAHQAIYGMSYTQWKENHQRPATPEQMAAFEARKNKKQ